MTKPDCPLRVAATAWKQARARVNAPEHQPDTWQRQAAIHALMAAELSLLAALEHETVKFCPACRAPTWHAAGACEWCGDHQ